MRHGGGHVEQLPRRTRLVASKLVDERLVHHPHYGTADILAGSIIGLLPAVPQILRVSWAHIGALEVADEDALQVALGINAAYWKILNTCTRVVGEVEG